MQEQVEPTILVTSYYASKTTKKKKKHPGMMGSRLWYQYIYLIKLTAIMLIFFLNTWRDSIPCIVPFLQWLCQTKLFIVFQLPCVETHVHSYSCSSLTRGQTLCKLCCIKDVTQVLLPVSSSAYRTFLHNYFNLLTHF